MLIVQVELDSHRLGGSTMLIPLKDAWLAANTCRELVKHVLNKHLNSRDVIAAAEKVKLYCDKKKNRPRARPLSHELGQRHNMHGLHGALRRRLILYCAIRFQVFLQSGRDPSDFKSRRHPCYESRYSTLRLFHCPCAWNTYNMMYANHHAYTTTCLTSSRSMSLGGLRIQHSLMERTLSTACRRFSLSGPRLLGRL